jgi:hypothetical protein
MDLYVAVSRNGGATFGALVRVNRDSGSVWGQVVSRPRIAAGPDGTWHVAFVANEMQPKLGKPALTTHYTRSTDGGASFAPSRRLSTLTDADMSGVIHGGFASAAAFGGLTVDRDGAVHVLWIDTRRMMRETDTAEVYGVVSRDGGATFGAETLLVEGDVCPCCQLVAVPDARNRLLLGSRLITADGHRPSTVARSIDADDRFGAPVPTGGAPWKISGCPLKPTALGVRGDIVHAASHNGGETPPAVILATSRDGGASFGPAAPVHPAAQVSDSPSIAVVGDRALVAWHAKATGLRRIYTRVLDGAGTLLGEPVELAAPAGTSQYPVLATRTDGRVQIAWQQGSAILTTVLDGPGT